MALCGECKQEMTGKGIGCTVTSYKEPDGFVVNRLKYGQSDHDPDDNGNCTDCNCPPGTYHHPGCDTEVCPYCDCGQAIGCDCEESRKHDEVRP